MREEDSNWFSKWDEELPPPEDLMPLSQSLITPDLALAFNIPNHEPPPTAAHPPHSPNHNSSAEFESPELSSAAAAADETARTLKRPRLVWTPQLHKRFVDAVAHLGIKNAVPKTIMQLMSVDGLTRENVASHLQKYRLYLKRMQSISAGGSGGAAASGMDSATDHLFASSPVPAHFLHPGRVSSEHFLPFVPVAMQQHHHQLTAAGPGHHHHAQMQGQFRHFGSSDHLLLRQSQQQAAQRGGGSGVVVPPYVEDLEASSTPASGREVLTLFPTGDD